MVTEGGAFPRGIGRGKGALLPIRRAPDGFGEG
jgi:hypothetical protein